MFLRKVKESIPNTINGEKISKPGDVVIVLPDDVCVLDVVEVFELDDSALLTVK